MTISLRFYQDFGHPPLSKLQTIIVYSTQFQPARFRAYY